MSDTKDMRKSRQTTIMALGLALLLTLAPVLAQLPAAGFYVALQPELVQGLAEQLSIAVADEANTDTTTPPVSGQSGSVKYTLSNFIYDIDLASPVVSVSGGNGSPATLTMEWQNFNFIFQMNYDVSRNPLSEKGYVQIYTTAASPTALIITATVDLSGPNVNVGSATASLSFQQGAVDVFVQCTSTLCLIPVDDIAKAAAQGFAPAFQSGVATAFNTAASQYLNTISLSYPATVNYGTSGAFQVSVELQGSLQSVSTSNGNVLVVAARGAVDAIPPGTSQPQPPPFSPPDTPPASLFSDPSSSAVLVTTAYTPLTLLWALNVDGFFSQTLSNSGYPELDLETNSTLWLFLAPGLAKFPNMDIQVAVSLGSPFTLGITSTGAQISAMLKADFTLVNGSLTVPSVFTYLVGVSSTAFSDFEINGANVVANTSFSNWNANVTVTQSQIGSVFTFGLGALLTQALQTYITPLAMTFPIIPPGSTFPVALSSISYSWQPSFISINAAMTLINSWPESPCGDGSSAPCPEETTCCNWPNGWSCCTLPQASCCSGGGCCPQGSVCQNGQCYLQEVDKYLPLSH